ncbi:MAG: thioester reductase domain-containing protein [Polyangia bacterium]
MSSVREETLIDVIRNRADAEPDRVLYRFLDGDGLEATTRYSELHARSAAVGAHLQRLGAAGERVLIVLPPGLDYIAAFFGCLYAGAVAVPLNPPEVADSSSYARRLASVGKSCSPKLAITSHAWRATLAEAPRSEAPTETVWIEIESALAGESASWIDPGAGADTMAFLQYTSGSTGDPKGVILTHGNILANQRMTAATFGGSSETVQVGWLPMFHDMGLIGNLLYPLWLGARAVLMSPQTFIAQPVRWLEAISRFGGTISGGPNFGYDLCVKRVRPEQLTGVDLGSWQVAFSGSEPVRAETIDRFSERFGASGFRRESFLPCYGLAEATLFVAGTLAGRGPRELRVGERRLVGCGAPSSGCAVEIVAPDSGRRCADGEEGEIWVGGPSIGRGYFGRPQLTREIFEATLPDRPTQRFLRTGDLGFVVEGELVITGRLKELIILRGRKLYCHDVEFATEAADPAIRPGRSVATALPNDLGEETLAIFVESAEGDRPRAEIAQAIRRRIAEEFSVQPAVIVFLPPNSVPKTTSGKRQRGALRQAFLDGRIAVVEQLRGTGAQRREAAPPTNDTEAAIHAVMMETLELAELSIHEDFFAELGGDSVSANAVVAALRQRFSVALPLRSLYDHPTVQLLASEIDRRRATGDVAARRNPAGFDPYLYRETELDPEITLEPFGAVDVGALHRRAFAEGGTVLVTGATGYLGPCLVARLLRCTEARVVCLVRGDGQARAMERLQQRMQSYGVWRDEDTARIEIVLGSLELPRFGLSDTAFRQLARRVDAIFHNGAQVNFLHGYDRMRATNVGGTRTVLQLAASEQPKLVFYSSTQGIYSAPTPDLVFGESDEPTGVNALAKGYSKSKWIAEKLMRAAQARGLPITLFRIGMVSAHSHNGVGAGEPILDSIVVGCVQAGCAPEANVWFDMVPVDFVAAALVELAGRPESIGGLYNVNNPVPIHVTRLFELIRTLGYELPTLPFKEWKARIMRAGRDNALHPFLALIEDLEFAPYRPRFQCDRTTSALTGSGIECPDVSTSLLTTYFEEHHRNGRVAKPPSPPRDLEQARDGGGAVVG